MTKITTLKQLQWHDDLDINNDIDTDSDMGIALTPNFALELTSVDTKIDSNRDNTELSMVDVVDVV